MVTLPGVLMRGRQSTAMLRLAGLDDWIAADAEDYAEKALTLARESVDRAAVSAAAQALFDDGRPLAALTSVVSGLLRA